MMMMMMKMALYIGHDSLYGVIFMLLTDVVDIVCKISKDIVELEAPKTYKLIQFFE
jgi:hypothetical protein